MRVIALGPACNNACIFCAQGELRARDPERDVVGALSAVAPGDTVAFVGGEPTLHDELPRWIASADARGASSIVVQTNGRRLAYATYARVLREASPRLGLEVSLHGASEAMHDYHTQVSGSFRQTALGLRHARAEGLPTYVTTVVTRSNFRHLAEILRVAHACGARAHQLVVAEPVGSASRAVDRVVPALELVRPYLLQAVAEARRLGLALRVGDQASDPSLFERFAGLGEVEPASALRAPAAANGKLSLQVLGRPAPARREERTHDRRTGEDLRAILPDLFAEGDGPRPLSASDIRVLAKAASDAPGEPLPRVAGARGRSR
jgi:MoaA/NifB/PqqE/SkfB family radical SAM enzyme